MKLEKVISSISAVVASCVVFVFACGMYLQFKGFSFLDNGEIVLIKAANAKSFDGKVDANIILPKGHLLGDANAPDKMYVFSSYGCYACAKFHTSVLPEVVEKFVNTKKLAIIFVDFPLDSGSMQGAVLAGCLPKEKYLSFADELFLNQRQWARSRDLQSKLIGYAEKNGMSNNEAKECLANKKNAQSILDMRGGAMENIGINATPSILFVVDGQRRLYEGALRFDQIQKILNKN